MDPKLIRSFAATVDWLHAGMIRTAESSLAHDREQGLGGKFFYAGDLDGVGNAMVVAANIAGAATLTCSAEIATQKQAIRDGVIDFLVTSLDEALRILKNEIRKRGTVAVCVAQPPDETECEMASRGVQPDLLPPGSLDAPRFEAFLDAGAQQIEPIAVKRGQTLLLWSVADSPAHWLPKLDAIAQECLSLSSTPETDSVRRWLRLSPRYLGRMASGKRLLRCETETARGFIERMREQVESGAVAVPVEIQVSGHGDSKLHCFCPPQFRAAQDGLSLVERQMIRSGPTAL
jgi:hypothetical protein